MQPRNAIVIAKREYIARIKTKGFWISTIALPLLIAAMFVVPALLLSNTQASQSLVMVDETGSMIGHLQDEMAKDPSSEIASFDVTFETLGADRELQRAELDRRVLEQEIDAWVWIDEEGLANDAVEYHAESVSNFLTQDVLEDRLSAVVRRSRLEEAGLDPNEVDDLVRSVGLKTVRVSEEGSHEEGLGGGIALAYGLFFILYMILLIYGQQVMNGVLEEKTSRVVEVIVSTTRPFDLMMGKLLGICGVALTQLVIWLGTVTILTVPGLIASIAALPPEMRLPTLSPALLLHALAFFFIGFFIYSTFYGAIGAAFNNLQEAQQFAGFAVIFLVAPMLMFYNVINDPDSTFSVVTSLIPPFTPLLMVLRLAVKAPPVWQIALGYLLSMVFAMFMVWLTSRIYRIGILMYGKKPTLKELWRWVRYA